MWKTVNCDKSLTFGNIKPWNNPDIFSLGGVVSGILFYSRWEKKFDDLQKLSKYVDTFRDTNYSTI